MYNTLNHQEPTRPNPVAKQLPRPLSGEQKATFDAASARALAPGTFTHPKTGETCSIEKACDLGFVMKDPDRAGHIVVEGVGITLQHAPALQGVLNGRTREVIDAQARNYVHPVAPPPAVSYVHVPRVKPFETTKAGPLVLALIALMKAPDERSAAEELAKELRAAFPMLAYE